MTRFSLLLVALFVVSFFAREVRAWTPCLGGTTSGLREVYVQVADDDALTDVRITVEEVASGDLVESTVFDANTLIYPDDPDNSTFGDCNHVVAVGADKDPDNPHDAYWPQEELLHVTFEYRDFVTNDWFELETFEYYGCSSFSGVNSSFHCPNGGINDPDVFLVVRIADPDNHPYVPELLTAPYRGGYRDALATADAGVESYFDDGNWMLPYNLDVVSEELGLGDVEDDIGFFMTPQTGPSYEVTEGHGLTVFAGRSWEWDDSDVTELRFPQDQEFVVEGDLDAEGVTFTAADANDGWEGVLVSNPKGPNPSAYFEDATIEGVTSPPLTTGGASVTTYNADISLVDTEVTGGMGFDLAGVLAAGPDALVHITSATKGDDLESRVSEHTGDGVVATNDAEVRVTLESVIEENGGSGVYASNGGRVVLDESFVLGNARYGLEAYDYAEIDFVDLGVPSLSSSTTDNTIAENDLGGVLARDHASVSAGSYNDLTGECYQCENTIEFHSVSGAPVDVKAETGSVVFAESNFWGEDIASDTSLVLDESGGSMIEVTPILTSPPSATGRTAGVAHDGRSAWGTETAHSGGLRSGFRAVFVEAREAAAEGDYVQAFVLLRDVIVAAEDAALRRLAYTEATRLLRRTQPPSVVSFLESVASGETGGSEYRPWALRALVVAYAAAGRAADAEAAATALADGYGDGGHARYGTLAQFRLRLATDDLAGAGAALAEAESVWPEHPSVEEAGTVYALASDEGGTGARSGNDTIRTNGFASAETRASTVPDEGAALAVYPNPVRSASGATVALTLNATSDVDVVVYDVLGREVVELHEGTLDAGRHPFRLESSNLPAGVYLVRVEAEGHTGTVDTAVTRRVSVVR